MSDYGSLQADATAVLALLRAGGDLVVFPAVAGGPKTVPAGTVPPYVAVHFAGARPLGGRLDHRSTRTTTRIYLHCVGTTDASARAVSEKVAGKLLDVRPAIAGRTSYPIRHETSREPDVDESTGTLLSSLTEVYRLDTEPG